MKPGSVILAGSPLKGVTVLFRPTKRLSSDEKNHDHVRGLWVQVRHEEKNDPRPRNDCNSRVPDGIMLSSLTE